MSETTATVLIVDDEQDMRDLLCDALRADGLQVQSAASGAEAFAMAQGGVDLLVADLRLPDCSGLDVLDRLREQNVDLPAVVITGLGDAHSASEATGRGCADFLTKPLDMPRLCLAVRRGLSQRKQASKLESQNRKLQALVRAMNRQRREMKSRLNDTCAGLTSAYRTLARQMLRQEAVLRFQRYLLTCQNDDDVFRGVFRFFTEQGGPTFGIAMVCDAEAELQLVGRFGSPGPDSVETCQQIASILTDVVLEDPTVMEIDGMTHAGLFPDAMRAMLPGVTFLCIPLLPKEGRLIGLTILYRKAEQPFKEEEIALAKMIAPSIALRIMGNAQEIEE